VRGGKAVAGDLEKYVEDNLYALNPQLPADVRNELREGNLTPWAPFSKEFPPPASGTPVQQAFFNITNKGQFQVNNASYDPDVVNITRQVNTSDDWVLTANGEPHIYHIHVNPFEVMDVLKVEKDGSKHSIYDASGHCRADLPADELKNQYCSMYHVFRDTVFVENGYEVHTRTYYDRYIGEFVIHCHILDHEDAGMMLNISVVPNLKLPGGGMDMSSMRHSAASGPHVH
jgi:FtsP/CotA-like multicopper oxidase with cupredoxin domain